MSLCKPSIRFLGQFESKQISLSVHSIWKFSLNFSFSFHLFHLFPNFRKFYYLKTRLLLGFLRMLMSVLCSSIGKNKQQLMNFYLVIKIVKFQSKICMLAGFICIDSWGQFCMKIRVGGIKKKFFSVFVIIVVLKSFWLFQLFWIFWLFYIMWGNHSQRAFC